MKHYRYIGAEPSLVGTTALGQMIGGELQVFKVQVDRFDHPWSHFWWETLEADWEEIVTVNPEETP